MPPTDNHPDLVILVVTILALIFSPTLAAVLAPYIVILLGALLGTGWGLKRRPVTSTASPWSFVLLMLGTALIVTMPAAVYLQRWVGDNTFQWLLAPIALVIGAIGEDWTRIGIWAVGFIRRVANKRADTPEE